jgi:hypothetical protein
MEADSSAERIQRGSGTPLGPCSVWDAACEDVVVAIFGAWLDVSALDPDRRRRAEEASSLRLLGVLDSREPEIGLEAALAAHQDMDKLDRCPVVGAVLEGENLDLDSLAHRSFDASPLARDPGSTSAASVSVRCGGRSRRTTVSGWRCARRTSTTPRARPPGFTARS